MFMSRHLEMNSYRRPATKTLLDVIRPVLLAHDQQWTSHNITEHMIQYSDHEN